MNLTELHDHELRVPIQRIRAEIHTERERTNGQLLLAPLLAVDDLFEDDAPFVPADVDGATRLFARSSIAAVVVEDESPPGSLASLGVPYELRRVAVHLRDGSVVEGTIVLSPTLRRTLDVLNQPAKSFAVHSSTDGIATVTHVAKAHVVRVEELA